MLVKGNYSVSVILVKPKESNDLSGLGTVFFELRGLRIGQGARGAAGGSRRRILSTDPNGGGNMRAACRVILGLWG